MDAGSVVDGRYEICRPLSTAGGMGNVYLCFDQKLKRQVAVKLIKPEHSAEADYRERFKREVEAAIALEGYEAVRIYDHGGWAERHVPYYVMEYLRGRDLRQELDDQGPLELSRALEILVEVCGVIAAAHAHNIVHRDLKPNNLFIEGPPSPRRSVKVLDFGIARVMESTRDGALTKLGGQPGSPNYMSPEQHKNDFEVGVQADIWALGAILYEVVVGKKAWPGESHEVRKRVIEDAPPSARDSRPELPNELDRVIRKCLEKDPADRYSSVRELEEALRNLQAELSQPSKTLPTVLSAPLPSKRRRRHGSPWVVMSLVGLVIPAASIGVGSWWRQAPSPPVLVVADPLVSASGSNNAVAAARTAAAPMVSAMTPTETAASVASAPNPSGNPSFAAQTIAYGGKSLTKKTKLRTPRPPPTGTRHAPQPSVVPPSSATEPPPLAPKIPKRQTEFNLQ